MVRECETERLSLIVGDTNDPTCLGFHSVNPGKVRGRSTAQRGEQYSIRLQPKALNVVRSSGVPRKDFARLRMLSRRLALEASLEMWLSHERSWQIVRPRSLNERTSSRGLLREQMGVIFQTVLLERHRESVRFVRIERHVPFVGAACNFIQIWRE